MSYLFLLFLLLLIIVSFAYKKSSKMVASPVLIFSAVFLVSSFICLITTNWIIDFSFYTVLLIVFCILCFGIGQFINVNIHFKFNINIIEFIRKKNKIKANYIYFFYIIQFFFLIIYVSFFLRKSGGISLNSIRNVRSWMLNHNMPFLVGITQIMAKSIAMINIYDYSKEKLINKNIKLKPNYLLPTLFYIIIEILSTSRSGIIYFFGYVLIIEVFFVYKINKRRKAIKKTKKIIIIVSSIIIIAFLGLGVISKKVDLMGYSNMFSVYLAGSIYNLNEFILVRDNYLSPSFGYFSFPILNSIKNFLKIPVPSVDTYYFPFIIIKQKQNNLLQTTSNLYTCIVKPLTDFGLLGGMFFFLVLGKVYAFFYKKILQRNYYDIDVIIYGYLMMPIFCASAEYAFGSFILSPMGLYTIIFILFFYYFSHYDCKS